MAQKSILPAAAEPTIPDTVWLQTLVPSCLVLNLLNSFLGDLNDQFQAGQEGTPRRFGFFEPGSIRADFIAQAAERCKG